MARTSEQLLFLLVATIGGTAAAAPGSSLVTNRFGCDSNCTLWSAQRRYVVMSESLLVDLRCGAGLDNTEQVSVRTPLWAWKKYSDDEPSSPQFRAFTQAWEVELTPQTCSSLSLAAVKEEWFHLFGWEVTSYPVPLLFVVGDDPPATFVDYILLPYSAWNVHGRWWTQEQVLPIFAALALVLGAVVRIAQRRHTARLWLLTLAMSAFVAGWSAKTYHLVRAVFEGAPFLTTLDVALCVGVVIVALELTPAIACAICMVANEIGWRSKVVLAGVLLPVVFFGGGVFVGSLCALLALVINF